MLKPASAASIAGVKKLKVGVKFWQLAFIFGGLPFLTVGFSFSQGVLNFYYVQFIFKNKLMLFLAIHSF